MKRNLIFICLFVWGLIGSVQAQQLFGDACLGKWSGTMYILNRGVLKDSVNVRLTVARTDSPTERATVSWTWRTEYLSPTRPMTKDYVLRLKDAATHAYVTDEGGGLELTDYLFGNKLYSVFETGGITLTSTYELLGDRLIFEVTSGKKEPAKHPEVTTFSVTNLQRVVFKRE